MFEPTIDLSLIQTCNREFDDTSVINTYSDNNAKYSTSQQRAYHFIWGLCYEYYYG